MATCVQKNKRAIPMKPILKTREERILKLPPFEIHDGKDLYLSWALGVDRTISVNRKPVIYKGNLDERRKIALHKVECVYMTRTESNDLETLIFTEEFISTDLSTFKELPSFQKWMNAINDLTVEDTLALPVERFIHGYCEDWALFFAIRYGVDMLFLNRQHNLIRLGLKYYDAVNSCGVLRLTDLDFVRETPKLCEMSENELQSTLVVDEDWKSVPVLANNIYLIEKLV